MKKRTTTLLFAALAMASLLIGCAKADITYNALDYVTLGDYKGMPISLHSYEITDESLRSYVVGKMNDKPYDKTDKTTAESGDIANIDYTGKINGEAFSGGSDTGHELELGSGQFIAGFEDGVIGMNVGETKDINLTFPADYTNTDLAGKDTVFTVTLNSIDTKAERKYEDLTDSFVKEHYSFDTVQAFLDDCRTGLESENKDEESTEKQSKVLEKLPELCTVNELPKGLLEDRLARYAVQMKKMLDSYSVTMEDYLKNYNLTQEDYDKQLHDKMEANLKLELVLEAIAAKENITVDENDYKAYIDDIVKNQGYENEEALYKEYTKTEMNNSYLCDKALTFVMDNATVSYDATDNTTTDDAAAETLQ